MYNILYYISFVLFSLKHFIRIENLKCSWENLYNRSESSLCIVGEFSSCILHELELYRVKCIYISVLRYLSIEPIYYDPSKSTHIVECDEKRTNQSYKGNNLPRGNNNSIFYIKEKTTHNNSIKNSIYALLQTLSC